MDNQNLDFLKDDQSIALLVRQLRDYFKDSYAHYKVERGQLLGRMEAASDEEEAILRTKVKKVDQALYIFGVLSDALSIANRVLHASSVVDELGRDGELYQLRSKNLNS
jgi:hypothetical protein